MYIRMLVEDFHKPIHEIMSFSVRDEIDYLNVLMQLTNVVKI